MRRIIIEIVTVQNVHTYDMYIYNHDKYKYNHDMYKYNHNMYKYNNNKEQPRNIINILKIHEYNTCKFWPTWTDIIYSTTIPT